MTEQEIRCIVDGQRNFFLTGNTLDVEFRIQSLQKLKTSILKYESEIHAAIQKDLGKSEFESYMCETGLTLSEITYMLKHIHTSGSVPFQKLSQAFPSRCSADHESVELSVSADHRATGGRHCCR